MADKTVTITAGSNDGIVAKERHEEISLRDKVIFELGSPPPGSPDDTLQIIFKDHEAFDQQSAFCKRGAKATVTSQKKGTHDYMVIARIGGKTFQDLHCPSIHVG